MGASTLMLPYCGSITNSCSQNDKGHGKSCHAAGFADVCLPLNAISRPTDDRQQPCKDNNVDGVGLSATLL
jgi:hypothetical protein